MCSFQFPLHIICVISTFFNAPICLRKLFTFNNFLLIEMASQMQYHMGHKSPEN